MVLAPPVQFKSTDPAGTSVQQFLCTDDFLSISPHYYGIPTLCGLNTKQHGQFVDRILPKFHHFTPVSVYVHFNVSERPELTVTIDIHLKNRVDHPDLVVPSWTIKFTQLECPLKRPKFDPALYGEIGHINSDFNLLGEWPASLPASLS